MFGTMFGNDGKDESVLDLDPNLCNPERLKILFRLICSLIVQMKDVYEEQSEFLDDFLQQSGIKQCDRVHSVCRPIR